MRQDQSKVNQVPTPTDAHRLFTIRISHYCEKARWALERLQVPYREYAYMPLLHMAPLALLNRKFPETADEGFATRFTTPVLVTDAGKRIRDSDKIIEWANERYTDDEQDLYPCADCHELEHRFGAVIGPHARRLAYYWALPSARAGFGLARDNAGRMQAALFCLLFPVIRHVIRNALNINPDSAERSRRLVFQEIDFVNEYLGSSPYLVSDRFTAADLALACMLAPALLVSPAEGYGAVLPNIDQAHPEAAAFARELRATPAGKHAMRMFRNERRA